MTTQSHDSQNQGPQHKVALITGSAKRLGAAMAKRLHQAGFDIVLHYRQSAEEAKTLRDQLNAQRAHSSIALQADLSDSASRDQLAEQARSWKQRLDVLVNNASSFYPTPLGETTQKQWDDLFAGNAQAPFFLSQALAPTLKQHQGCIINIIDALLDQPDINFIPYTMAKTALRTMTLGLAKALAPEVRVNGIAPGVMLWPEHEGGDSETYQQTVEQSIPMGSMGTPEDITRTLLFLVESAPYVTGQILAVDGGRSLYPIRNPYSSD